MASRAHSSVSTQSMGNLRLSIITFTDIDNADTYDSGIPSAVSYWANGTDTPTANRETVAASYAMDVVGSPNAGRFTFSTSEDNRAVKLYVLSRT